jgi:hypothetical protein
MSELSNYLEDELLDHVLGGGDYTAPDPLYLALADATVNDATTGTTISEPSGNNYSRDSETNNATNFPAASGGAKASGAEFTFPTPSGSWGTITDMAFVDAATNGNMLAYTALAASKVISNGNTVRFASGAITLAFKLKQMATYLANELLDHVWGNAAYSRPATVYIALFELGAANAFTADNTTDTFTDASHGLSDGDAVLVTNTGGALPSGLSEQTRYFIVNSTTNTFQLAIEPSGTAVSISDDGTGTQNWHASLKPDGTGATEATYTNYARVAVTNNATNFPASSGGSKANGIDFTFPSPSGASNELAEWAIFDASTSGNMLFYAPLTQRETPGDGDAIAFSTGNLTVALQ